MSSELSQLLEVIAHGLVQAFAHCAALYLGCTGMRCQSA